MERKWFHVEQSGGKSMFIGQYSHNLDEKNRIIIPSKFRAKLGANAIITYGYEQCLTIYTEKAWEHLQEKLLALSDNKAKHRKHVRILAGSACECSCDSQGRVILPANLIAASNIKKEIVIVGNLDHIEIWAKERWQAYYADAQANFDELAENLLD